MIDRGHASVDGDCLRYFLIVAIFDNAIILVRHELFVFIFCLFLLELTFLGSVTIFEIFLTLLVHIFVIAVAEAIDFTVLNFILQLLQFAQLLYLLEIFLTHEIVLSFTRYLLLINLVLRYTSTESVAIDVLNALLKLEDLDLLEVLVGENTCCFELHVIANVDAVIVAGLSLFPFLIGREQLGSINTIGYALRTKLYVCQLVCLIGVSEATLELTVWQKLRAHVTEEVDETLGGCSDGLVAEVFEQAQVLDLLGSKREWHPHQNLTNRVEADRDVLIVAVFRDVVRDDPLNDRSYDFRRNHFVTRFNDHGEDLADLVLRVARQVPQQVRIESRHLNFVTTNETRDQSQHIQFDLVAVVALLQLRE